MARFASAIFTPALALFFLQVDRVCSLASCNANEGFSWSYNSLNQDPCTVASFLGGVCNDGQYSIPAINSTESYSGPTSEEQTPCRCSTVFYSLLMACAECQEGLNTVWTTYSAHCQTVIDGFSGNIPSETAVDYWAYLNVIASNGFNATAAQEAGDSPEITAPSTPSSPASSSSAAANHTVSSSSTSDKGAIAGGVVGGVAGLVLIVAATFWFLRKRSRDRSHVSGYAQRNMLGLDMTGTTHTAMVNPSIPERLYDPSDPSTFPTNENMVSPSTTHVPYSLDGFGTTSHPNPSTGAFPQTHYAGHAEV